MSKLIKDKSEDKIFFKEHVKNTSKHMTGNHQICSTFYNDKYKFKEITINQDALNSLNYYLKRISDRVEKIKKGLTSNLAECYFSVNCKFQAGKIKNFI